MPPEANGKWFKFLQNVQTLLLAVIVGFGGWFATRLWDKVETAQATLMENRVIMVQTQETMRAVAKENELQDKRIDMLDSNQRNVIHRLDVLENGKAK